MIDFRISKPGDDVTSVAPDRLILDERYPTWKCDVRKNPRNYGIVQATVGTLTAGQTKTIYSIDHTYKYTPSFIVAWRYPAGTSSTIPSLNQTFGVGFISIGSPLSIEFDYAVTDTNFAITVTNSSGSTASNLYAEFRFYIFAEDFPQATTSTFFL